MAKSRIGPFALEAPLAPPTAAGQIFRGVHVEQQKLAAVRVFPTPLGMTPESRLAFVNQLEEMKQLRHPGIVRCYGGGFDQRKAFLAYELIDGQSLDNILDRRGRLPWELTLEYAQKLGEALRYAQEEFHWCHGRLQPSKLIIAMDGQPKIADWRRDQIALMLSSPPTVEQLQMSAPEVLAGKSPSEKSDMYSLGAIMFMMLAGHPPFQSSDAASLRKLVENSTTPSVAAEVLDCPVWLNAIVQQLLSKSPDQRPFSLLAFLSALREAQRRQSEGVGVLQHAAAGFSALDMNLDRNEAEKVLGIKQKTERVQREGSFWESPWFLSLGLVLAVGIVTWFLLPLSEDNLRQRAEKLLDSQQWLDWNEARDSYLQPLIDRFPDGKYHEWAEAKILWVNAREAERRLDRDIRLGRRSQWTQAQIQLMDAKSFEQFGDTLTALEKYRAIRNLFGDQEDARSVVFLADEAIERIGNARGTDTLPALLNKKMTQAEQAYQNAQLPAAKMTWESIVELYAGNAQVAPIVEQAKERLAKLQSTR